MKQGIGNNSLGCLLLKKYFVHFTNSKFYSWLTTAPDVEIFFLAIDNSLSNQVHALIKK